MKCYSKFVEYKYDQMFKIIFSEIQQYIVDQNYSFSKRSLAEWLFSVINPSFRRGGSKGLFWAEILSLESDGVHDARCPTCLAKFLFCVSSMLQIVRFAECKKPHPGHWKTTLAMCSYYVISMTAKQWGIWYNVLKIGKYEMNSFGAVVKIKTMDTKTTTGIIFCHIKVSNVESRWELLRHKISK